MAGEDWRDWEFETDHHILVGCVGYQFGEKPEENLPAIRAARGAYGHTVAYRMALKKSDIVMDIGSGCGFVGRSISPYVKQLYCADLSASFLNFCTRELADLPNVATQLITYADFTPLKGKGINRAYSTAVWIHFNFYDVYHYLKGLNAILPIGGTVYFDYADPDGIRLGEGNLFRDHSAGYKSDRSTIAIQLNYNSLDAIKAALDLTGFALDQWWRTDAECCSVLIRKISDNA